MGGLDLKLPEVKKPFIASMVLVGVGFLFLILFLIWSPVFHTIFVQQVKKAVELSGPVCNPLLRFRETVMCFEADSDWMLCRPL